MAQKNILALDLGTTGNRAIVFNKKGKVLAQSYFSFKQYYPNTSWVEHDPIEIWLTTKKAILDVLTIVSIETISCIGITNQRETTVLWDKSTGNPIHPAIVWQCRRSQTIVNRYKDYAEEIKQKTGLSLDPYFSASKIQWLFENVEAVKSVYESGNLLFGTIDTWVLWNLTKEHKTDPSNASRTLIYNIRNHEFDTTLCNLFKVPKDILPTVQPSASLFGVTKQEILGKEIPVTGILGDQQAALFGQCGFEKGVLKNTYGTGLFMISETGSSIPQTDNLLNTIAWEMDHTVTYAIEGSVFIGGAVIQWLRDGLGIIENVAETEALAHSVKSNEGVFFVPAFVGLGAPYWDSTAGGLCIGLTRGTTKAHITRAALESMAYQSVDLVNSIQKELPELTIEKLRVDGGACVNNFLMQFQADILNMPVERPVICESTAIGVAGMAGIGAGLWTKDEFSQLHQIERVFMPQMEASNRHDYLRLWHRAISHSQGWKSIS